MYNFFKAFLKKRKTALLDKSVLDCFNESDLVIKLKKRNKMELLKNRFISVDKFLFIKLDENDRTKGVVIIKKYFK